LDELFENLPAEYGAMAKNTDPDKDWNRTDMLPLYEHIVATLKEKDWKIRNALEIGLTQAGAQTWT
jgi:hypothetical protein